MRPVHVLINPVVAVEVPVEEAPVAGAGPRAGVMVMEAEVGKVAVGEAGRVEAVAVIADNR